MLTAARKKVVPVAQAMQPQFGRLCLKGKDGGIWIVPPSMKQLSSRPAGATAQGIRTIAELAKIKGESFHVISTRCQPKRKGKKLNSLMRVIPLCTAFYQAGVGFTSFSPNFPD